METGGRTLAVAVAALLALSACMGAGDPAAGPSGADTPREGESGRLVVEWRHDAESGIGGNHHAPAAGRVDGRGVVLAPISGRTNTTQCGLVALAAANGSVLFERPVPPEACTLHAVADPTLADFDADGRPEALAATTERLVVGLDPVTGREEFNHSLSSYGYTQPVVANLTGDGRPEVVVVDSHGTVEVLQADGSVAWTRELGVYAWGQPSVRDFDADGAPELAVGLQEGRLLAFEGDGSVAWNQSGFDASIYWQTARDVDDDSHVEVVVATVRGSVAVVDGADGELQWSRFLDWYAAAKAVGDGDDDGELEVYAGANGTAYALSAADGGVEWSSQFTTQRVSTTAPPMLANLTGDGDAELLAAADNGTVALLDPATGKVMDTYHRSIGVQTHPGVADGDGDGRQEAYVVFGDGVVVAFGAERSDS